MASAAAAAREGSAAKVWHSSSPLRILVKCATSRADLISGAFRWVKAAGAVDQSSAAWSGGPAAGTDQQSSAVWNGGFGTEDFKAHDGGTYCRRAVLPWRERTAAHAARRSRYCGAAPAAAPRH
jgi:hypothetical protein